MSDLIDRQAALSIIRMSMPEETSGSLLYQSVKQIPTIDAVDVVRCKDCMKYDSHGHRCKHWNHGVVVKDFCSRAERRADG